MIVFSENKNDPTNLTACIPGICMLLPLFLVSINFMSNSDNFFSDKQKTGSNFIRYLLEIYNM